MKHTIVIVPFSALAAALLGTGCVSIDIGKPEAYTKEFLSAETPTRVVSMTGADPEATVDVRQLGKGRIGVGLKGDIETKAEKERVFKKLTVERQRKLDFGFGPAWREILWDARPGTNMVSMVGTSFSEESKGYENHLSSGCAWTAGFFLGFYGVIPYACLVEPFYGDWSCSTHHWVLPETPAVYAGGGLLYAADETGDRLKVLEILSSDEFRHLGVKTRLNSPSDSQNAFASQFTHSALFGFHRWSEVRIFPLEEVRRERIPGFESRSERKNAVGPFRVTVSSPARHWEVTAEVPKGRAQAWFDVPDGIRSGEEIEVRFSSVDADVPATTAALLEAAGETVFRHAL